MDFSIFLQLFNFFHIASKADQENTTISPILVSGTNTSHPFQNTSGSYRDSRIDKETGVYGSPIAAVGRHKNLEEDCRGVYGCFPTSSPWEGPDRPVSLPPESLEKINPFFCLHSFNKPGCRKIYPNENLELRKIDISSDSYLIVITHGFIRSTEIPWLKAMVSTLLENLEDNLRILTLDWQNGATPPYAQAVANTRLMGAVVGRLLERLVNENGLRLSHTHLVAHSLGAHLFGYTGSFITRADTSYRIGRITGLDPAGPFFRRTPPEVRLDFSDAFLVDIIHTDSTSFIPTLPVSLGLPEASGHLDFFPNGGGEQKGCRKSPQEHILAEKGLGKGIVEFITCSHERSHRYLTASVPKRCNYIGVECSSWKDFMEGKCWDCSKYRCFKMGFDLARVYPQEKHDALAPKEDFYHLISDGETKVKLFLATTANENLCGEQLRFSLIVSNSEEAIAQGGEYAQLGIVLRGQNGSAKTTPRKESTFLIPGDKLQWVDAVPSHIGEIHSIVVTYEEEQDLILNPLFFRITAPALHLQEIVVESLLTDTKKRFKFCEKKISSGETVILKRNCTQDKKLTSN